MTNDPDIPSLTSLIIRRDKIQSEIDRLTVRRNHIEALISVTNALIAGEQPIKTFEVVRQYFDENEIGDSKQVLKYAASHFWNTMARDRLGAIRTTLSHMANDGELVTVPGTYPIQYRKAEEKAK